MDTSRFRNYGLWVSVCALVPMVFKGFGVDILPENYNDIVYSILSILVMAGILSNPTTSNKGFLDDRTAEVKETAAPVELSLLLNSQHLIMKPRWNGEWRVTEELRAAEILLFAG